MGAGTAGLEQLLTGDGQPCPICDEFECSHEWFGKRHYRLGDPPSKHPNAGRRHIPSDRRIIENDRLMFAEGALMTDEEAVRYGVAIPGQPAPGRKKGRRQRPPASQAPQGAQEDRASELGDNREAGQDDPHQDVLCGTDARHDAA